MQVSGLGTGMVGGYSASLEGGIGDLGVLPGTR